MAAIQTPWGPAEYMDTLAPGIVFYASNSHGGFHLSPDRLEKIDPRARAFAAKWSHGFGDAWFEEDCAWSAVAIAFPQYFQPSQVEAAFRISARFI
jgi:hypothetical protein